MEVGPKVVPLSHENLQEPYAGRHSQWDARQLSPEVNSAHRSLELLLLVNSMVDDTMEAGKRMNKSREPPLSLSYGT